MDSMGTLECGKLYTVEEEGTELGVDRFTVKVYTESTGEMLMNVGGLKQDEMPGFLAGVKGW